MNGTFAAFKDWAAQPFRVEMDIFHWFLFLGLIILIAFAWRNLILNHILDGVGE